MSFLFFCFTFYTNFLCVISIFLSVAWYKNYLNTSCRILSISFLKIFKVFLKNSLTLFFYLTIARSFIILTSLISKVNSFSHVSFSNSKVQFSYWIKESLMIFMNSLLLEYLPRLFFFSWFIPRNIIT